MKNLNLGPLAFAFGLFLISAYSLFFSEDPYQQNIFNGVDSDNVEQTRNAVFRRNDGGNTVPCNERPQPIDSGEKTLRFSAILEAWRGVYNRNFITKTGGKK
jgi:hypothetical protein